MKPTTQPFDPDFDDCAPNDGWLTAPYALPQPGTYGDFTIKSWLQAVGTACGQPINLPGPVVVHGLLDADGTMWMSDTPQERLMMYNDAIISRGRVLVGGLGLGIYPQYALPYVEAITIVELSTAVQLMVEPVVRAATEQHGIPLDVQIADIDEFLSAEPGPRYDTIFLDTWNMMDETILPEVNRLRDLAFRHLAADGRILLWGYYQIVRRFKAACRKILLVEPDERAEKLTLLAGDQPGLDSLLSPVVEQFAGQVIEDWDAALAWCKDYAIGMPDGE